MKIAVIADVHVGLTRIPTVRKLLDRVRAMEPDLVVLAGDLGEPLVHFEKALDLVAELGRPVAVLAGNHDLWHRQGEHTSEALWSTLLPEAVRRRNQVWLETENVARDDLAVVGTLAWYDYSARCEEQADRSEDDIFKLKRDLNNDATYIRWQWNDVEFARQLRAPFLQRLAAAQDDRRIRHIVVVTHVPLFPEQNVRLPHWDPRSQAYFGNWSLGREVERFEKVRLVVSGHTHLGIFTHHDLPHSRRIQCWVIGSDYGHPEFEMVDTAEFER